MARAIILFSTGEVIDIKSRNALGVAEQYLYYCFGVAYDIKYEYLNAMDNKGIEYHIFIEKGER